MPVNYHDSQAVAKRSAHELSRDSSWLHIDVCCIASSSERESMRARGKEWRIKGWREGEREGGWKTGGKRREQRSKQGERNTTGIEKRLLRSHDVIFPKTIFCLKKWTPQPLLHIQHHNRLCIPWVLSLISVCILTRYFIYTFSHPNNPAKTLRDIGTPTTCSWCTLSSFSMYIH